MLLNVILLLIYLFGFVHCAYLHRCLSLNVSNKTYFLCLFVFVFFSLLRMTVELPVESHQQEISF